MIPVVDLDSIQLRWLRLEGEGFVLYGFLLYTNADTGIWSFIHNGGMLDLDYITGSRCAVFVLDCPTPDFVKDAQKRNHVWYRYFSKSYEFSSTARSDATTELPEPDPLVGGFSNNTFQYLRNSIVVIGSRNNVLAESLLEGPAIDRYEIGKVLDHLRLDFSVLPCITWFRSLDDTEFDVVDLRKVTNQHSARNFFRQYFESPEFNLLLKAARV